MAALIRKLALAAVIALAASLPLALATPGVPALGQDGSPSPPPTRAPTCQDRFPAEGPAGVDLRLGCIVGELVGLYTASSRDEPVTLSVYVLTLAASVAVGLAFAFVAVRLLARRASRRLAPVLPSEWWICPRCHSVNATGTTRCYACGGPPGDGPTMATDSDPVMPQGPGVSSRG